MAKKRRGPTLLEVMPPDMRKGQMGRIRYSTAAIRQQPPVASPDEDRLELSRPWGWLSPGQAIRVPVGYIFIAAAAVVILAVAVFYIGYSSGDKAAVERLKRQEKIYGPPITDPVVDNLQPPVLGKENKEQPPETNKTAAAPQPSEKQDQPEKPATELTTERVPGLNYYIVASAYPMKEAQRLVEFLRANKVPAAVFGDRYPQVWVLKGFTREQFRNGEAAKYKKYLLHLGRIWKSEQNGSDSLDTMYPKKYTP